MTTKKSNPSLDIKQLASETSQISWSEQIQQHSSFQWIVNYGSYLMIAAIILIAILLFFYRTSDQYSATAESDYMTAAQNFSRFQKEVAQGANREVVEGKNFKELRQVINRRPELHAKYDGAMAQLLILLGASDLAEEYAQLALARTSADALPDYSDYSQATLLIVQEKPAEALAQAQNLKERLLEQTSLQEESRNFGDLLYGYNLLRLALLHQQQGNREEEYAYWNELKSYAGWSEQNPSAQILAPSEFNQLMASMREGNATLQSYVEQRVNTLKP